MPIVYIHGVAIRDDDAELAKALRRFRDVPWPTIEESLREHLAPVISDDPAGVPVMRIYWGDLGAHFAWGGASLVSRPAAVEVEEPPPTGLREKGIQRVLTTVTALRRPLEEFIPTFLGDVLTYIATRGNAAAPGPIPQRVLDGLEIAAFAADARGEPLVVVTHSMGGQILYDALTHFLPRTPRYQGIRVDFWCSTASQVGLFEELKLFLESSADHSAESGRPAPHPPAEHLGGWWNVWDHADLLSFRAEGIIEGVDDSAFFAAGTLATDHNRYLANVDFYRMLATRVREHLESERSDGGAAAPPE